MERNEELKRAWDFVENTRMSIFLTGKAGTGKTTFLRTLREHSAKRMVVLAPTGVAAVQAEGMTIHSFFQLSPQPFVPGQDLGERFKFSQEKRNILRTLDLLVIDEISMVRSDLLDAVDDVLRRSRHNALPFGGVQLLMIGDLRQLTPITTPEDEQILQPYYTTPYFFGSHALQGMPYITIELQQVFRQQDEDFIALLNAVREGKVSAHQMEMLNARYLPDFAPKSQEGYIRLTTHNASAQNFNQHQLSLLPGRAYTYEATVEGNFPAYSFPTEESLVLREGAQVMFVKNDTSGSQRYFNGKIGYVSHLGADRVEVRCEGDGFPIEVSPEKWENRKYVINEETKALETQVQGTFEQYPLRLAWAITIHKSQGLTFERAIIDVQRSFAAGQVYVALSRCKSLEGMVLVSPLVASAIIKDERVEEYISRQQEEASKGILQLPQLKESFERSLLEELFIFSPLYDTLERVGRTVGAYFHLQPKVYQTIRGAADFMKKEVMTMAERWMEVMRRTPLQTLKSEAFQARIRKSATYFQQSLSTLYTAVLADLQSLETGNKTLKKRLDNQRNDFDRSFTARLSLLKHVESAGFDRASYMQVRQETFLRALDKGKAVRRSKKKKANPLAAEKGGKKTRRGETKLESIRLYLCGMDVREIAAKRQLTETTIEGHLAYGVREGMIDAERLLSPSDRNQIYDALMKSEGNARLSSIKALCPPGITYFQIKIAKAQWEKEFGQ